MLFVINKVSISFLTLILIGFVSCSTLDYDSGYGTKIVMNSHLSTTANAQVYLTESFDMGVNIDKFYPVQNADVWLYEDELKKAHFNFMGVAKYEANYVPLPDKTYTIKAYAPTLPSALGAVAMPKKPQIRDFNHVYSYNYIDTVFDPMDSIFVPVVIKDTMLSTWVSFKFKDFDELGNYYRLIIRKESILNKNNEEIRTNKVGMWNNHTASPYLNWMYLYGVPMHYYIFSDEENNGAEFTLGFELINSVTERFPIKYYIYFEHLSAQTIDYYRNIGEHYKGYRNVDNDSTMNVDIMKTDFTPNYVPYIMDNPIEGGYGFITTGSGMVDSVIYLKRPD